MEQEISTHKIKKPQETLKDKPKEIYTQTYNNPITNKLKTTTKRKNLNTKSQENKLYTEEKLL